MVFYILYVYVSSGLLAPGTQYYGNRIVLQVTTSTSYIDAIWSFHHECTTVDICIQRHDGYVRDELTDRVLS